MKTYCSHQSEDLLSSQIQNHLFRKSSTGLDANFIFADEAWLPGTPEPWFNQELAKTSQHLQGDWDQRVIHPPPVTLQRKAGLADAEGVRAAVVDGCLVTCGGELIHETGPCQTVVLDAGRGTATLMGDMPWGVLLGHTITALAASQAALVIGGTSHSGLTIIDLARSRHLSIQLPAQLPRLQHHTAVSLPASQHLPTSISSTLVFGGSLLDAAVQHFNSQAYLLTVDYSRRTASCTILSQVPYPNNLTCIPTILARYNFCYLGNKCWQAPLSIVTCLSAVLLLICQRFVFAL